MILEKSGFNFAFDTNGCRECLGNCCVGSSGYIWVNPNEIEEISKFLNLSESDFISKYLYKIKYRYSIKEVKVDEQNFACVFFDLETRGCKIYEVRPNQCKTFPFWDYFKDKEKEVIKECPAIKLL
jgi:uncharacterized protein